MAMYIGNPAQLGPMPAGPDSRGSPMPIWGGRPRPQPPIKPIQRSTGPGPTPPSTNVLGAQAVRPTGPSQGYDPQYLQNLATAVGGLFSRPQGNLNFNPLGNLSDVASPGLGFGNAPLPGLPPTMLQDAINNLAFMFNQPAAASGTGSPVVGGNGGGRGRSGGRFPWLQ